MNKQALAAAIRKKQSFLCVGLDSDIAKIPPHLLKEADPVYEFNKQIIAATAPYCVSYKLNTAFYESRGVQGWKCLEKTLKLIPEDIFTIADAKRGDIGNTGRHYAKAFFEALPFHAITLSPYMGEDSITPFLEYKDKWAILLGLTSNAGAKDFQMLRTESGKELYLEVIEKAAAWGTADNMMFVTGATRAEEIKKIRELIPEHFLLVPGVGAQGGSLEETAEHGINKQIGLLINSSRGIIFKDQGHAFAERSAQAAKEIQEKMSQILHSSNLI